MGSERRTPVSPAIQFDYETTRVYLALTQRLYCAKDMSQDYSALRVGLSLYEAEYDQTQPWLILEARRNKRAGRLCDCIGYRSGSF